MKAQDLRIGNLFNNCGNVDKATPNTIEALFESEDREWIKPIPLTEEWLLKMGFEFNKAYNCYVIDKTGSEFILDTDFKLMDIDLTVRTKHVHQLQNLYHALTGEELTI